MNTRVLCLLRTTKRFYFDVAINPLICKKETKHLINKSQKLQNIILSFHIGIDIRGNNLFNNKIKGQ